VDAVLPHKKGGKTIGMFRPFLDFNAKFASVDLIGRLAKPGRYAGWTFI